jgi:hypothetical protein
MDLVFTVKSLLDELYISNDGGGRTDHFSKWSLDRNSVVSSMNTSTMIWRTQIQPIKQKCRS